jgi:hypothetical protein
MSGERVDFDDAPRIADRLAAARQSRFVGRRAEREVFEAALMSANPPFVVLYLYGPGGVGKTALLHEFARLAATQSRPVLYLDGRHIEPSPPGLLRALQQRLGREDGDLADTVRDWPQNGVLLIDTYETLAPLDSWLREGFLPHLPAQGLVVIAGRTPPTPAWRTDLAWADLTRTLALNNLQPDESRAYLAARGIPDQLVADVLAFTHGHPLALALVADLLRQGTLPPTFHPADAPDVVRILLERLIHDIPTAQHQQALEICGLAWATTEALLAETLDQADAPALFAWLRGLSFIEQGPYGLFPHDLAREALVADLRWRNPAGHQQLIQRLIAHLTGQLEQTRGAEQTRLWFDLLSLTRQHPFFQSYFDWDTLGASYAAAALPDDYPAILAMVEQHEGGASAQIAAYWLRRQPDAFLVFRAAGGALLGFMAHLALQSITADDEEHDPAVAAAWQFIERHGPLRAGETLLYLRFWMSQDAYQGVSPALNLAAIHSSIAWTTHSRPAWSLVATSDLDFHAGHFNSIQFRRAPEADFTIAGRHYGIFAHDWRVEPVSEWLNRKIDLAAPGTSTPHQPLPAPPPSRVVLTREVFADAVRQALRDYTHPDRLAANPLLQTRLLTTTADQPSPAALRALLRDALATLQTNPKDLKFHHAIRYTYIEPVPTQEQAAERLGLPFNTYRYHLAQGITRITDWLWQREIDHGVGVKG